MLGLCYAPPTGGAFGSHMTPPYQLLSVPHSSSKLCRYVFNRVCGRRSRWVDNQSAPSEHTPEIDGVAVLQKNERPKSRSRLDSASPFNSHDICNRQTSYRIHTKDCPFSPTSKPPRTTEPSQAAPTSTQAQNLPATERHCTPAKAQRSATSNPSFFPPACLFNSQKGSVLDGASQSTKVPSGQERGMVGFFR